MPLTAITREVGSNISDTEHSRPRGFAEFHFDRVGVVFFAQGFESGGGASGALQHGFTQIPTEEEN